MRPRISRFENSAIQQVIVVHRHGDRTPIASQVGVFKQSEDLDEFWKQTLPSRQRLSAWGAVDEDPTETYLALKGENSTHPGWPNGLLAYRALKGVHNTIAGLD